jgi:hypothetical protein
VASCYWWRLALQHEKIDSLNFSSLSKKLFADRGLEVKDGNGKVAELSLSTKKPDFGGGFYWN